MKHDLNIYNRRQFLNLSSVAALSVPFVNSLDFPVNSHPGKIKKTTGPEWRNRQSGMVYRKLGRTGFMVSEIAFGSERITVADAGVVELAIERGINYFDTAPQYGKGVSETTLGRVFNSSSKREKVFLATKLSAFPGLRNRLYREIYDGLPAVKQEAIQKKALELRKESDIEKPGYFLVYWPGQPRQLDGVFLSDAMMPEYGERVEGHPEFRKLIMSSVEESLKRVGTDYFDILHCPHAANSINEIKNPFIAETFRELKKQGKVRFLGLSTHSNMSAILDKAVDLGYYDVVMLAYNVINYGFLDHVIRKAKINDIGILCMKAAMAVFTPYPPEQVPIPDWRVQKLNQLIPDEMKLPVKAYLWALQNPDLSAVVSGIRTKEMLLENLSSVGRKVELQPG